MGHARGWSDEYLSHERVSVTLPGAAIANVASGRTSPVHSRHSSNECYIGEIVQCATMSQKLLAHHNAAGSLMLMHVHKKRTDALDMQAMLAEFIEESEQ